MSRLKLAATAAALLGGLAMASAAQAFTFLNLTSSGQLYDFDSATGAITAVGTETTVLEGLGQLGSTVYGESTDQLYSISSAGVETAIGSAVAGVTFVDFGSTTGGLYAISTTGDLYTINDSTGAATLDGSLGLGTFASHVPTIGLSTGSSTLFFADGTNMYALNTTSGAASPQGGITEAAGSTETASEFGALMFESGTLYGGANSYANGSHTGLVSFNSSFDYTALVETSPNNTHATAFWGMAPGFGVKVLPEPSDWALMVFGVGAVGGALRARRRKATAAA
jgi:hypothetical protein